MLTGLSAGTNSPLRPPGTISTSALPVIGSRSFVLASLAVFTGSLVEGSGRRGVSSPKASRRDPRLLLPTDHLFPSRSVFFEVGRTGPEAVLIAREGAYAGLQEREPAEQLLGLAGEALALVPPGQADRGVELPPCRLHVEEDLERRPQPVHVHASRRHRHHDPVGHGRGGPQDLPGVGRRVDYHGAALLLQGPRLTRQAVPSRLQDLEGELAGPGPLQGAALVVRVQDDRLLAPLLGHRGEVKGAGGLTHTALQVHEHDNQTLGSCDTVFTVSQ